MFYLYRARIDNKFNIFYLCRARIDNKINIFYLCRARIDNKTTKSVFVMLSDEKLWLINNFENEPDVGFPGYFSHISG